MKNTIFCIGRQYGSGGREVAELLAQHLGIPCYDKLLIQQTACESGLSETIIAREEEKPLVLDYTMSGNPFADSAYLDAAFYSAPQRIFEAERQTILDIASKGSCVIVGRCASSILRGQDYPVLSVFVYADEDDRIRRIADRNGLDAKAALRKMQKVDRLRRRYFDFYSDTPWGEPASYDLMISSSRYGMNGAARLIEQCGGDSLE